MDKSIGFIGIGFMGGPMAQNLLKHGCPLIVRDRTGRSIPPLLAAGAVEGGSPRDIADQAEIIFLCVPHNDAITKVMLGDNGIINGKAVKLVVNLGTTGSAYSRDMTAKLA